MCSGSSVSRQQWVGHQIDLTYGEVVGGPPPGVDEGKLVVVERSVGLRQPVRNRCARLSTAGVHIVGRGVASHAGKLSHGRSSGPAEGVSSG